MAFTMMLWEINNERLIELPSSRLDQETRLEEWIAKDPSLLGLDVLIIGRQVQTSFGGRIDLLGMDRDGNLSIIELKRDRTPRDIVAQVLDYASWITSLSAIEIDQIATEYLKESLHSAFQKHFQTLVPENINSAHSMMIVASSMDDASERIVQYLTNGYDVNINVVFFTFFKSGMKELVGRSWLLDPEQVSERAESRKKLPWSGYYFVNVGEGDTRNWDDCRAYGFIAAGGGRIYSDPLKKLKPKDKIFAYMKTLGYVGLGEIITEAVPAEDFTFNGRKLFDLPLKQPHIMERSQDTERKEWTVGVRWLRDFDRDKAKKFPGIFANQNIVCKLRDERTLEFLKKEFGINQD